MCYTSFPEMKQNVRLEISTVGSRLFLILLLPAIISQLVIQNDILEQLSSRRQVPYSDGKELPPTFYGAIRTTMLNSVVFTRGTQGEFQMSQFAFCGITQLCQVSVAGYW